MGNPDVVIFLSSEAPPKMVGNTIGVQGRVTAQVAPFYWSDGSSGRTAEEPADGTADRFEMVHDAVTQSVGMWCSAKALRWQRTETTDTCQVEMRTNAKRLHEVIAELRLSCIAFMREMVSKVKSHQKKED